MLPIASRYRTFIYRSSQPITIVLFNYRQPIEIRVRMYPSEKLHGEGIRNEASEHNE